MELQHIEIGRLRPSPLNMRHGRKAPDISDLLPSVRARGILQPKSEGRVTEYGRA